MKYCIETSLVDGVPVRYTVPANGEVTSIFFLGLGQRGKNLGWVADTAPDGMVVVEGIPYVERKTKEDMIALGKAIVLGIFRELGGPSVKIFSESQSSPAVILAFAEASKLPKSITCITPLGFSYDQLGNSKKQRTRSLGAGAWRFWRAPSQSLRDKANRETFYHAVISHVFSYKILRTITAFELAANLNVVPEANELTKYINVHVFAAESDEQFPYSDIRIQLDSNTRIKLHKVSGGHLNRATSRGREQLNEIYAAVVD